MDSPISELQKNNQRYFKSIHPAFKNPVKDLRQTFDLSSKAREPQSLGDVFNFAETFPKLNFPNESIGDAEGMTEANAPAETLGPMSLGQMMEAIGTMGLSVVSENAPQGIVGSVLSGLANAVSAMTPMGALTNTITGISNSISGLLGLFGEEEGLVSDLMGLETSIGLGVQSELGLALENIGSTPTATGLSIGLTQADVDGLGGGNVGGGLGASGIGSEGGPAAGGGMPGPGF